MTELAVVEKDKPSLVQRFAGRYGVDGNKLLATLRATCFNARGGEVSNEQMMALLIVADQYKLNPFTKELFAFPDKGGIVPVVSVDGWARIINENPQMDGIEFEGSSDGLSCTCRIYRKDRKHPTTVTEYMSEVRRDTQPWKSHPRRMLRHKTLIQCARVAFGFAGIYDEDEAQNIVAASEAEEAKPTKQEKKGLGQAILAHAATIQTIKAALAAGDLATAQAAWVALDSEDQQALWVAPSNGGPFTTKEREVMKSPEFRKANDKVEDAEFTEVMDANAPSYADLRHAIETAPNAEEAHVYLADAMHLPEHLQAELRTCAENWMPRAAQ